MSDKYTQMAEEWLQDNEPAYSYDYTVESLANELRRVAREQIEEDAEIAEAVRIDKSAARAIRSRAKELED